MFFVFALFIGVALIFLGSIPLDSGQTWLAFGWEYILNNWGGSVVSSFILLGVVLLAMAFITSGTKRSEGGGA